MRLAVLALFGMAATVSAKYYSTELEPAPKVTIPTDSGFLADMINTTEDDETSPVVGAFSRTGSISYIRPKIMTRMRKQHWIALKNVLEKITVDTTPEEFDALMKENFADTAPKFYYRYLINKAKIHERLK